MNKNLQILSLALGLAFIGCQTENISEDIHTEDVSLSGEKISNSNFKIHEPLFVDGPGATIHEPIWIEGPSANIHEPIWIAEMAWFECGEDYTGAPNLTVNKNNPAAYSSSENGMVSLKNLNVGGNLSFCGLLAVENTVNIHRAGEFDFVGEMMIGTVEEPADLVINSGAHLNFAGNIIVTGDLIINKGATVEILGEGHDQVFTVGGNTEISEHAIFVDHREHDHDNED